jgi:hypothetical protein
MSVHRCCARYSKVQQPVRFIINLTNALFLVLWPTCLVACTVIEHSFLKWSHIVVSMNKIMYRNILNLLCVVGTLSHILCTALAIMFC